MGRGLLPGGSMGFSIPEASAQTEFWGRMPPSQSQAGSTCCHRAGAGDSGSVPGAGYVHWVRSFGRQSCCGGDELLRREKEQKANKLFAEAEQSQDPSWNYFMVL